MEDKNLNKEPSLSNEEIEKFLNNYNGVLEIKYMKELFCLINYLNESDTKYFFRGQADSKWNLESSYVREENKKRNGCYKFCLDYLFEEKYKYLKKRKINKTKLEFLAQMQHYENKSPLIDFTSDILHALWFAFSDDYEPDFKKWFRTIYIYEYKEEIKYDIEQFNEKCYIYKCPFGIERGISQKSYFVLDNIEWIWNHNIKKINISNFLLSNILKWLNSKNISGETIYPDEKGLIIDFEKNSFFYFHYKSLGLFHLHKYEEALKWSNKALKINPENKTLLRLKHNILQKLGKHEEIIEYYGEILENDPKNISFLIEKAFHLNKLEQYEEALKCYDKVLEFDPRNTNVLSSKGMTLRNAKRYEEAIKCYNKILKFEPKNISALINIGITLDKWERYEEAIQYYDKVFEIDFMNVAALIKKGMTLLNAERHEEAIECYEKLSKLDPINKTFLINKAFSLRTLGREKEAKECENKIKEIKENEESKKRRFT